VAELGAGDVDPVVGEPRQQLLERHACLEAGERRAEAEVRPEAEGQVLHRRACDVEGVGMGDGRLVAVG
jgi:Xaa-Pro aminopeptidase